MYHYNFKLKLQLKLKLTLSFLCCASKLLNFTLFSYHCPSHSVCSIAYACWKRPGVFLALRSGLEDVVYLSRFPLHVSPNFSAQPVGVGRREGRGPHIFTLPPSPCGGRGVTASGLSSSRKGSWNSCEPVMVIFPCCFLSFLNCSHIALFRH